MTVSATSKDRPVVLTFVAYYLPAFKSGGPVRSIANLVEHLGDHFDFRIITADRDARDFGPFPGVSVDNWNQVGKAMVYYASPSSQSLRALARLCSQTDHDAVYLNSVFDPVFTVRLLLARRVGWLPKRPVVLAPRGEFSAGALSLKRLKKRGYRYVARLARLYSDIRWQASSEYEVADIMRTVGAKRERIFVAPNLPRVRIMASSGRSSRAKDDGSLRMIFLSRITPKKHLDFALRTLKHVRVPVEFNIYGPVADDGYWEHCQAIIRTMPHTVTVSYKGSVHPDEVSDLMEAHDLFFLPTLGENYGHVIAEAITAGTPVLIGDTTPWRHLESAGLGWDLPLNNERPFVEKIHYCASIPPDAYRQWRDRISKYAHTRLTDDGIVDANRRLFTAATVRMGESRD